MDMETLMPTSGSHLTMEIFMPYRYMHLHYKQMLCLGATPKGD